MTTGPVQPCADAGGKLGIFWVFRGQLLSRTVSLTEAERRGNRLDSPLAHVSVWPGLVAAHRKSRPLLSVLEYDEVPRGRVIFDIRTKTFVVYMDASLFCTTGSRTSPVPKVAEALRTTFDLQGRAVRFATDPHYRLLCSEPDDDAP